MERFRLVEIDDLPTRLLELVNLSKQRKKFTDEDRTFEYIAHPAIDVDHEELICISGLLGIRLMYENVGIAVAGYNLHSTTWGWGMQISHTPQGIERNKLSRSQRNYLFRSNFRVVMLQTLTSLSASFGLNQVEVISYDNYPKVCKDMIDSDYGYRVIDSAALEAGFHRGRSGNYYAQI